MSKQTGNMFDDKEAALEQAYGLLKLIELLAARHDFPFLSVIEHKDWLHLNHYFPEQTCSELKAAWYELKGEDAQV